MKTFLTFLLGTALLGAAAGDSAASVRKNLERMPRPWQNPAYHPAPEDETYEGGGNTAVIDKLNWERYEAVLRDWAEQYDFFTLEELGRTFENDPIYLVKITSPGVPADQKFRIALTSLHTGSERSPLYALMAAMEFLCSPEAQKYRDRYEIAIVPSGNPYGFFRTEEFSPWNSRKVIPYAPPESDWDIRNLSFKKIADSPEIAAFCKLIDAFQPEIHIDWHGVGRHVPGEIMLETVNGASSNHTIANWSRKLDETILRSAAAAGYNASRMDEMLQRLKSVTAAGQSFPYRFRESREQFYTGVYPYLRYHTLPIIFEIGREQLAVNALKGMLDFGLNPPPELDGGLPVDNLRTDFGGLTVGSGGVTPGEKRASRVELWNQIEGVNTFRAYPRFYGRDLFVITLGRAGIKEFFGDKNPNSWSRLDQEQFFAPRTSGAEYDWEAINQFLRLGPETQLAPQGGLAVSMNAPEHLRIEHGLSFAFDIPVAARYQAEILDLRVNGFELPNAPRDGWQLLKTDLGYRVVIKLSGEKCADHNFFIVSCGYTSDAPMPTWGWKPQNGWPETTAPAAPATTAETPATSSAPPAAKPLITENFETLAPQGVEAWNGHSAWGNFHPGEVEIIHENDGGFVRLTGKGRLTARTNSGIMPNEDFALSFDLKLLPGGSLYCQAGDPGKPFAAVFAVERGGAAVFHLTGADGQSSRKPAGLAIPENTPVRLTLERRNGQLRLRAGDKTGMEFPAPAGCGVSVFNLMSAEGKPAAAFEVDNFELKRL